MRRAADGRPAWEAFRIGPNLFGETWPRWCRLSRAWLRGWRAHRLEKGTEVRAGAFGFICFPIINCEIYAEAASTAIPLCCGFGRLATSATVGVPALLPWSCPGRDRLGRAGYG